MTNYLEKVWGDGAIDGAGDGAAIGERLPSMAVAREPDTLSYPPVPPPSPELLHSLVEALRPAIQAEVATTVTAGLRTVIPDIIELTLARQAPPSSSSLAPVPVDYQTPVPTMHLPRPAEARHSFMEWLAALVVVVVLGGVASMAILGSPQASTERALSEQGAVLQDQSQALRELAEKASKSECKALCF